MIRGEMHERATKAKQYRAQAERARASAKSFMQLADNYEKMADEVEPEGQSRGGRSSVIATWELRVDNRRGQ
jgi:hypothetical protein